MRTKTLLAATIAVLLALVSCNNNNENPEAPSKYITIDAGIGSPTPTRVTETSFQVNDKISVYSWAGNNAAVQAPLIVNNAINTYDGTKWTAQPMMLWMDNTTKHYFLGVHPVKAITDFTADQYATTPDLLIATVLGEGKDASNGVVPLIFDHVMARLDVNLTLRNQFEPGTIIEEMTLEAKPGATVNYLTKSTVAAGTVAPVAMEAKGSYLFRGVVAPQSASTIYIKIGGKTYTYTHPTGFVLVQGKIVTVNLIVGRDRIELGNVSINDWATGETINGGEAQ